MDKRRIGALVLAIASVVVITVCVIGLFAGGGLGSPLLQTTQASEAEAGGPDAAASTAAQAGPAADAAQTSPVSDSSAAVAAAPGTDQGTGWQEASQGGGSQPGEALPQAVTVSVTVDASAVGAGMSTAHVTLDAGASVMDALAASGFSYNVGGTQFGAYVSAIGGLAEKQYGATSGWTYTVNGNYPQTSCSSYILGDGDAVTWIYTTQA